MATAQIAVRRALVGFPILPRAAAAVAAAPIACRGVATRAGQFFVARSGAGGAPGRAPLGWGAMAHRRGMAISDSDVNAEMGTINDLFVEARELIADALDSQGSTYFEDDLEVSARPPDPLPGSRALAPYGGVF